MPNLDLVKKERLSSFRRIALGTWRTTYDPSVYGSMRLRIDKAMDYRDAFRAHTGRRLTLTHMMVMACADVMRQMPDANAIVRFKRIYLRTTVGIFFQVAMEDQETGEIDLSGVTIHDADKKSLVDILDETERRVSAVRAGKDKDLESTRSSFKKSPPFLLFPVVQLIGFLSFVLNLDLRKLGIPRDPFGSMMITNIGSLGLEAAYVPLVPYSHVPLLLALGAVQREPLVDGDDITIGRVLRVYATFDHRVLDGSHAARMAAVLKEWFENPEEHFGVIADLPATKASAGDEASPAAEE
jgi:pyruvate dehydrogenase E2 component (dihydrolipoamide acetyltransferase)